MRTIKKILLHFFLWTIWFATFSISYLADIENFPVWPSLYNYLSLVVISYSTYYLTFSLCNSFSITKAVKLNGYKMAWYIVVRWQTGVIALIAMAYPIVSWIYDGLMVKLGFLPYRYSHFFKYAEGRWARECLYIVLFITIAVFHFMYLRKNSVIRSQRAQNKLLLDHLKRNDQFLNNLDSEVKRYLNDESNDED